MPTVSRFYGVEISLRTREANHALPHFHAKYGADEASVAIQNLQVLAGSLPRRALEMVVAWAALHQAELMAGWEAAKAGRVPAKIAPLE